MADTFKSVFICYNRSDLLRALAISQKLSERGFDVHFDHGDSFGTDTVNFEQIRQRFHFLILLTPSALKSFADPNHSMRREAEIALSTKRNIVLLYYQGAKLDPSTGLLENLPALQMRDGLLEEDLDILCGEFLKDSTGETYSIAGIESSLEINVENLSNFTEHVDVAGIAPLAVDWYRRGEEAGDFAEKIHCYTEALRLAPQFALAYFARGFIFHQRNEIHPALQDYAEAIHHHPGFATAYCNRGYLRVLQGDADGALADCNEAIRLQPRFSAAYCNRGLAYRARGEIEKALKDYTQAIELDPQFASAYTNRGDAYIQQGKLDAAIADCNEAIRLHPNDYAAFNNRAGAYYLKNDFNNAIRDMGEVIRVRPDLATAHKTRAMIFLQADKYAEGIADLQEYLAVGGGRQFGDQDEVEKLILHLKTKT